MRRSDLSATETRYSAENSDRSWPLAPSSTKIASSPALSEAFSASFFARSATQKIDEPSFAHSKLRMAPLCSVSFVASPPAVEMTQICDAASLAPPSSRDPDASRDDRNAIRPPSGDHDGLRSLSLPRNWCARVPSASTIQIVEIRLLSFHGASSDFV